MSMKYRKKKHDTATLSNAKPERLRTPRLSPGRVVNDHLQLTSLPGVVIYEEQEVNANIVPEMEVCYVFMSTTDLRKEAELIASSRPEKFKYYLDELWEAEGEFTPYYMRLHGGTNYERWSEAEARANLRGIHAIKTRETELIVELEPTRNKVAGSPGRHPAEVSYWLSRLGYSKMAELMEDELR